jgi:hypothetical protein
MAVYAKSVETLQAITTIEARCNCTEAHPQRPKAFDDGCGVGSGVQVEIPAP